MDQNQNNQPQSKKNNGNIFKEQKSQQPNPHINVVPLSEDTDLFIHNKEERKKLNKKINNELKLQNKPGLCA